MKNLNNKAAFITGVLSDIGEAFSYEWQSKNVNLIITAYTAKKLEKISIVSEKNME